MTPPDPFEKDPPLALPRYPVHETLPALRDALKVSSSAVLSAPPGSGKTTVVPLELLAEPWMAGRSMVMLEPRRLAARAAAARMADLLGEPVGRRVGYRVRFDSRVSADTRIEVVTEGILTRRLQGDPGLEGVALVVFDEFHLRSIHADLALALCGDVMTGLRDDLRLLVMSATLDGAAVAGMLNAPLVKGHGRAYSVELHYLDAAPRGTIAEVTAAGIRRGLAHQQGDLLAFLPGAGEIREVERRLGGEAGGAWIVCPLYGDLSREAQDRAIRPLEGGPRRVVLATAIAETSLTIEGITTVVDSGWSRLPRFDPNSGLTRLETLRVSLAAADQRAGRAGRLGPGVCYRLWSAAEQTRLAPHTPPEIMSVDLAPLALELAHWGVADAAALNWLDAPPAGAYAQAVDLLTGLEALDGRGRITATGRDLLELPLHPRLAHMMMVARDTGQAPLAADMAALLSERDVFRRSRHMAVGVDVEDRLQLLGRWRQDRRGVGARPEVDPGACAQVEKAARQLVRTVGSGGAGRVGPPLSVGGLLSLAFPDRIARRRSSGGYRLAAGRGARLPEGEPLGTAEFLVIPALDAGRREGRAFLAAAVEVEEIRALHGGAISRREVVEWDDAAGAVTARREEVLGAVTLAAEQLHEVDPQARQRALLDGIRQRGLGVLPWSREAEAWRQRLRALAHWQPAAGWPDVGDAALEAGLEEWLAPWLDGMGRLEHLKRLDLRAILGALLDWPRQQRMDALAPTHLQVPSGARKRLDYGDPEAPVLAVRIQEMFGLADTPAVCDGAVTVTLHLLSPAQRPIQVTRDLRGFWKRTYPEVKKELKGRYPKHYWPDDPWAAVPTARVRPRA